MLLIGICTLVYFLDGLIHSILGPLAPDIARNLSLTDAQLGPIFSANLAGQCIGLILLPLLASRVGQRLVVVIAVAGFGLAQGASALSESGGALVFWRLLTGFFLGGCLPSCLALVTAAAPEARRGFAIMVLFTGYGSGAAVAGLVAAAFIGSGGWRMAMVAVGCACILAAVAAWAWLHEESHQTAESGSPAPVRSSPLLILAPRYVLGTLMLWLLFICMLTVSYCLNSWLPTLLVKVGRTAEFAALSVSIFSFGGIVAALGIGLLIDRLGAIRTLVTFVSAGAALLYLVGQVLATAQASTLLVLLAACGFCVLGAYGGVNVVLASFYPAPLRAVGIGWAKSIGRAGTLIAPILIGAALTAGIAETSIMSLFAIPALCAVASLLAIAASTGTRIRSSAGALGDQDRIGAAKGE
ncbi:MAG TPA: MFS transporter [Steroidobacteraceae bacterium]|nr:MFS transporter [Steroidobacteraceae bacterium]